MVTHEAVGGFVMVGYAVMSTWSSVVAASSFRFKKRVEDEER